jgi:hypothetical protein
MLDYRDLIPGTVKDFFSAPWGQSGWGVKLTIYLHLGLRSRMTGAIFTPPIRRHGVVLS